MDGNQQVRVRRAVPGDEGLLRALRLEALSEAPHAFGSTYERERARTTEDWQRWLAPGATFIAEHADGPCGLVACARDPADSDRVWLMAMWVRPDCRGSGASDVLVESVLAWSAATGAREVVLQVVHDNMPARRCYQRHGFCATGREELRARDGVTEIEMSVSVRSGT